MRHLTLILAVAAFTFGGLAVAQAACPGHMQTVEKPSEETVASTGGGTTPVLPQPRSGS
jgi:hypothetical protein